MVSRSRNAPSEGRLQSFYGNRGQELTPAASLLPVPLSCDKKRIPFIVVVAYAEGHGNSLFSYKQVPPII